MSSYEASFYIPRVSTKFNVSGITIAFAFLNIGDVGRIDFNPIPGTAEFQSAFVHITKLYYNQVATEVKKKVIDEEQAHRVYPDLSDPKVYWILLANKSPVIDTKLNIHQIADNATKMWELLQKQQKMIEDQQKKLEDQQKKLDCQEKRIDQLKDDILRLCVDLRDEFVDIRQEREQQEQEQEQRKLEYHQHKDDDDEFLAPMVRSKRWK